MDSYEGGRHEDGGDRGEKDKNYDRSRDARDGDYSERRRRRSRSRERDYSRRDRSRSRERRRGEERDDRHYSRRYDDDRRDYDDDRRGHCDDRDSYDDRERDRDHRERRRWDDRDRRRTDDHHRSEDRIEPGPVVMLRNLRDDTRKEDLSRAIGSSMSYVRDIRLIQRRDGSNGFAFVEFYDTQDAVRWMEDNQDNFMVLDSRVNIEYSRHRKLQVEQRETRSHIEDRDWVCFKCDTMNFARRRLCMTCDCPRSESESLHEDVRQGRLSDDHREGDREENNPPSNVLILKGLDALSSEASVRQAVASVCTLTVRDVRLIRDKVTSTSRGFCFVELNNIEDAKELLSKMQDQYPAFFVDGRRVSASFARQNSASSSGKSATTSVASAAIAQAQWSMVAQQKSGQWQQQNAQYSAQGSRQQPPVQPQKEYGSAQSGQQSYQQAGASLDAQAQRQYKATSQAQDSGATSSTAQPDQQLPSTYSYDSTSGFYYDSATGLHYDPKTQYHYNSQTGQYCYYDSANQAYVAVDSKGNPVAPSSSTTATDTSPPTSVETKKKKDGTATVTAGSTKSAKKIAKDMERWAKSFNAAKASQQQQLQAIIQQERAEAQVKAVTTAPAPMVAAEGFKRTGIALSAALESEDDRSSLSTHTVEVGAADPGPTPLPQGADTNPTHTDWNQLACLLCKRKFPSRDVLIKHQQFSELHKQNLEAERRFKSQLPSEVGAAGVTDESAQYRDRAKERREKYGSPAIIPGWKRRLQKELDKDPPVPYEQPTKEGLGKDNIGSKMLQAMGWSDGQGLGKANQGITEPIKARMRQVGAGLGSQGSSYGVYSSSGSYKETLKNLTKARYEEMFTD